METEEDMEVIKEASCVNRGALREEHCSRVPVFHLWVLEPHLLQCRGWGGSVVGNIILKLLTGIQMCASK